MFGIPTKGVILESAQEILIVSNTLDRLLFSVKILCSVEKKYAGEIFVQCTTDFCYRYIREMFVQRA